MLILEDRPRILHPSECTRIAVQRLVELQKGSVDIDGTILSSSAPKEPGKFTKKVIATRSINNMGGGEREIIITWPMLMNISLSLMLVPLLSKRDRNRVAGRTSGSGGFCYIHFKMSFAAVLVEG